MWTALLVNLVLGATPAQDAADKDDKNDLKILARGVWPVRQEKPTQLVIRSGEEVAIALGVDPKDAREKRFQTDATADTAKLLKVRDIDWSKQMLVVVAAGAKRTGGYRVEILSLRVKEGALTVTWKLHTPAAGGIVTQAITYPSQMVLVERFQGPVRFDPPAKKK
jgi:hypothetical protein